MVMPTPASRSRFSCSSSPAVESEGQDHTVGAPVALLGRQHLGAAGEQDDMDRLMAERWQPTTTPRGAVPGPASPA
ncbi:hypothetical protein ACIQ6V_12295 [Streptomyces sp. NPDC096198]|uniref:hypothetical protein n=1 Tax=Streptomyces sp. NPDC096198 TaxID=3366080 RepID=UPI00382DB510